ncbi:MAG TPA: DUF1285 domain-containing protein [Micavibrio sp.]
MHELFYREDVFHDYDHRAKRAAGFEFTIDYQGRWYFHGGENPGPIKRKALAGLFGGAGAGFMAGKGLLRDENGEYWLKSPESRYKVAVEDVPFVITHYDIHNRDIDFFTNFDEKIALGPGHELILRPEPHHHVPVLYVEVRDGLWARLTPPVYNDIVENHMTLEQGHATLTSRGRLFTLKIDETQP